MKIGFDFVCDEALLYAEVAKQYEKQGDEVSGVKMAGRWKEAWSFFDTVYDIYSENDNHIDYLEIENITQEKIADYIIADRFLRNKCRKFQSDILHGTFSGVNRYLSEVRPDVFISTGVAYFYNLVLLALCKKYGVKHISLYTSRQETDSFTYSFGRGGSWDRLNENYWSYKDGELKFDNDHLSRAKEYYSNVVEKNKKPAYMNTDRQSSKISSSKLKEFSRRVKRYYFEWGKHSTDYLTQHPFWYAWRDVKRLIRVKLNNFKHKKVFDKPDFDDSYILYPLHLQPEASTLVLGADYENQYETIKSMSRNIPYGYYLYVKEHPSAYGRHSNQFYKNIKQLRNVKLISPRESTPKIIMSSKGLVTISGTMGWEAVLAKKKVWVLGDVFYDCFDCVTKLQSLNDINIKECEDYNISDNEIIELCAVVHASVYPGKFDVCKMDVAEKVLSERNVNDVSDSLKQILMENVGTKQA